MSREAAFDSVALSRGTSGFRVFRPKACKASAAFLPAAFAFVDLQVAAGSVPPCAGTLVTSRAAQARNAAR